MFTVSSTPDTTAALDDNQHEARKAPVAALDKSDFRTEPWLKQQADGAGHQYERAVVDGKAFHDVFRTEPLHASLDASLDASSDAAFRTEPMLAQQAAPQQAAIVVVDPMSTGANLAHEASAARGLPVICVWSDVCPAELRTFVDDRLAVPFVGTVQHHGDVAATCAALRNLGVDLRDVIVGSEPGVQLADELAEALALRGNGAAQSGTRRNKFLQSEACARAGLAIGAQALASCAADVEAFLASQQWPSPFKAVVKPVDGAASQGVTVCASPDEVRSAFGGLLGQSNVLGLANTSVLLMEFLGGDEFVVDTVSRDGEHKCVAVWRYIKGRLNGVDNVYYGMHLLRADAAPPGMIEYIFGVLDALGIRNGAIHSECKYDGATEHGRARGAVLIESNCRLHGAEGSWKVISERCLHYSHVSALLDAYDADGAAFAALPRTPATLHAHGAQVGVRSVVSGTISRIDDAKLAAIRALPSYVGENLPASLAVGAPIAKTVDIVTLVGQINLVHADARQLAADLAAVQASIDAGLFEV